MPASPDEREEGDRENRLKQEARILTDIARSRLDTILSAKDWNDAGLGQVNPIDLDDFEWAVYVSEHNHQRYVGVTIFNSEGVYDVREFLATDQSVPISQHRDQVNQHIARIKEAHSKQLDQKRKELRQHMEQERGFPKGTYLLSVTFPHRTGTTKTMNLQSIDVDTHATREDVLREARSWIQMAGLHNFGLDVAGARKSVLVKVVLKKDDVEIPFDEFVGPDGHIVKK